jgi:hypothetical protein
LILITTISIISLIVLLWQDIRTRSIHWAALAVLFIMLFIESIIMNRFQSAVTILLKNSLFLLLQCSILVCYYLLRRKPLKSIINVSIGLGDILMFFILTVAFSLLNFVFFYMIALVFSIVAWSLAQVFLRLRYKSVPLAGLTSACLLAVIVTDISSGKFDRFDDSFLIDFLCRMIL